ncbi:MAG: DNA polymerase I [Pseudomonadales bacterium]|nr:DNA polymerase I [Pseudomonadales bacterium]
MPQNTSPENTAKPPLLLVDGSSYLYRAFHALPPLKTSTGMQTGAVKGVISMIRRLIADYPDSPVAVVFDAKGKTFRHDMYKEYKANRPPMPDDLRPQIEPIHQIIKAMGLPLLMIEGVEADDVIGTLAVQATELKMDAVISTGDKDMAQLVNEHISLINTMDNSRLDETGVEEKFGVRPDQIIDYLALMGDKSDNVPGVAGVGPKTAVKWLAAYGDVEQLIEHADEIKGKIGEKLRNQLDQIPLSRELVTIKCDVELEQSPDQLLHTEPDNETLLAQYTELEFKGWVAELSSDQPVSGAKQETPEDAGNDSQLAAKADGSYEIVMTEEAFTLWLERLQKAELIAVDTETTSLDYMMAEIVGLSFSIQAGEGVYIPVAHDYIGAPEQLDRDWVLAQLKPLLEDPNKTKVGQNLKYDKSVLANYDISLEGIVRDTMLESYMLDSTSGRRDMDSLALRHLDRTTIHYEDVAGKGAKHIGFSQVPLEQAGPYAAEDADVTLALDDVIWSQLKELDGPKKVFETIEMPLLSVLSRIERNGALIDSDLLATQSHELGLRLIELETEAHDLAGQPFNLGSPKQLQEIFFEKLNLPVIKKTPKGQPSTAEPVLKELAQEFPLPKVILEYRSLSKLKSTYTDRLPEQVCAKTGRVHTSYHQAVTATGRLSSSNPNLQNIPVRTHEGRRIRQAFIAPEGYKLVAADYSQIELRIMAHLSADPGLISAFGAGLDIHKATAAEVFGVDIEQVDSDQRRSAKAINFGLMYGMSAFGLGNQLDIPRNLAQQYMDQYFERYTGVHDYMERIRETAEQQGYVETLFGRRLYLPEINSRNHMRKQAAARAAINAPMQGTAADIIKMAMIDVDQWLQKELPEVRITLQVHDELVLEIPEPQLDEVIPELKKRMEGAANLDVPLIVDVGIGDNWEQAH